MTPRVLTVLLVATAPAGAAQTWVPLSASGAQSPGLPALVTYDEGSSNEVFTTVGLTVFGFWREDLVGPDGQTYQRITVPGLGRIGQVGAPDLPALRFNVAGGPELGELKFVGVNFQSTSTFSNIVPAPTFTAGLDEDFDPTYDPGPGDTDGIEPAWSLDQNLYGSTGAWPAEVADPAPVARNMVGPVRGATAVVHPVVWNPSTNELVVTRSMSLTYQAVGAGATTPGITKKGAAVSGVHFINWQAAGVYWPADPVQYHSRYLVVAKQDWWDEVQPFVLHKKQLGYQTAIVDGGSTVGEIRNAIASWYSLGDPGMDHFVLLVGDTDEIPLAEPGFLSEAVQTDDLYGTVGAVDESKEVYVGRISADGDDELGWQLQKIIDYERSPAPGDYAKTLLVSHKEEAPDKYTGSHTRVKDASYATPPSFVPLFGESGVDNGDLFAQYDQGVGFVAYRGHGSTTTWSDWNTSGEDFHKNDVGPQMVHPMNPVVWNISCTNANLSWGEGTEADSLAEVWLEVSEGASAAYGATRTTYTTPNHLLNEVLFQIVFDYGVTTHGVAIAMAEETVWSFFPGSINPWAYLLLGDPSMTLRRGLALDFGFLNELTSLDLELDGQAKLGLTATSSSGQFTNGIVSVYKPSFLAGQADEMVGAWWLDGADTAYVVLDLQTPGPLYLTVRDDTGNLATSVVEVTMGSAWSDLGQGMEGDFGAPELVGVGTAAGATPWSLLMAGARPSVPSILCLSASATALPLFGGTLVPDVISGGLLVPLATDADGNLEWGGTWPDGVASGAQFYFQHWTLDDSGPEGLVSSNALRLTTP